MFIDPLLKEKYRVQKELAKKTDYDPKKYAQLAHQTVLDLGEKYGLTFNYAAPKVMTQDELDILRENVGKYKTRACK